MTHDPLDPTSGPPSEADGFEAMPVEAPRRAASLTLRSDDVRDARAASMEAANKSLADALRVTYRLLQVVMVALIGLFVLSGFQQVNQSESGIRVEFGRITAERLSPGFQFSLPYPLGQIVKVSTGTQTIELDEAFWPAMTAEERRRSLDEVPQRGGGLDPGRDGALLTGDSNIAHAQLSVVLSRNNPGAWAQNLYDPHEVGLVRAMVKRAAVQVAATVTVDDLLKPGAASGDQRENSVESRIRLLAQNALDELEVGIQINQVLIRSASPPQSLRADFNQVQIAQSNAGKARDTAMGERSKILNEAAGSAHVALLDLINDYEAALELGDETRAAAALAAIDAVLAGQSNGREVQIAGRTYADVNLSGDAAQMLSDAQQFSTTVVQQAQRRVETFTARREQYRANPAVFLTGAWSETVLAILTDSRVETLWQPQSGPMEILLTPDPQFAREAESVAKERDVENNPRVRKLREDARRMDR